MVIDDLGEELSRLKGYLVFNNALRFIAFPNPNCLVMLAAHDLQRFDDDASDGVDVTNTRQSVFHHEEQNHEKPEFRGSDVLLKARAVSLITKPSPSIPTQIGPISVKTLEDISQQIFTISK